MLNWVQFDGKIDEMKSVNVDVADVVNSPWSESSYSVPVKANGIDFDFNLGDLFNPILGDFWKVMYAEGDFKEIKSSMISYWKYRNKPTLVANVAISNKGEHHFIGSRLVHDKSRESSINANDVIQGANKSFKYNRVMIGSVNDVIEFQLLNKTNRIEVKKGDFVDPGLFIWVNGGTKIAAGTNRLVCLNGLTEKINVWESERFNFDDSGEMLDRSVKLASWLASRQEKKVDSIRELACLMNNYPKPMLMRFMEDWSKKVEAEELTWFDVINDITNYANKYLNKTRLQILQFSEILKAHEDKVFCPVCSTKIRNGV